MSLRARSARPRRSGGTTSWAAVYGGALLVANLTLFWRLRANRRRVPNLAAQPLPVGAPAGDVPLLSVILPARDEVESIRETVASLLRQDYPALEIVLVDDRSTDGTGRVMAELAAADPGRIRVVSIATLPDGWLGKNHALWRGARRATGAWLLFADADIRFAPTCIRRALLLAEASGADHLTLAPDIVARGYWLRAFVAFFAYVFITSQRPYLAEDPASAVGAGMGAFNLIRRDAYDAIGTHAAIALRPDDDMRLGLRVKRAGLRQRLLYGGGLLRVEWYPSLGAAFRGLEKNVFAGFDYSYVNALVALAGFVATVVAPYPTVLLARGRARWLVGAAIGAHTANYAYANWPVGRPGGAVLGLLPALPATGLLFCCAIARAVWLTFRRGGIAWRETSYPLGALRRQTGLEGLPG